MSDRTLVKDIFHHALNSVKPSNLIPAKITISDNILQIELDIDSYLKDFDSNSFFSQTDDLIVTGPTRTNVMNIAIIIKE